VFAKKRCKAFETPKRLTHAFILIEFGPFCLLLLSSSWHMAHKGPKNCSFTRSFPPQTRSVSKRVFTILLKKTLGNAACLGYCCGSFSIETAPFDEAQLPLSFSFWNSLFLLENDWERACNEMPFSHFCCKQKRFFHCKRQSKAFFLVLVWMLS